MNKRVLLTIAFGLAASAPAFGAEINIISAGAVEPGVVAAAEVFRKETGTEVKINPPPPRRSSDGRRWRGRRCGDRAAALIEELAGPASSTDLGTLRSDVSGSGHLTRRRRQSRRVVADALKTFCSTPNGRLQQASTGLYLSCSAGSASRSHREGARCSDGAAVMEHVIHGKGKEIGSAYHGDQALWREGALIVGPLPGDAQN
jgi:molybdate transport system substrate-binding protein